MSQEPIQLKGKQGMVVPTKGNTKSQNGGNSTNLSEGSNENIDEEFKVKKGEKFQFINQKTENWPQWSANEQKKQEVENTTNAKQAVVMEYQDQEFMYCRGMSSSMRKKLKERKEQQNKNQTEQTQQQQPQPKKTGFMDKIKNWFGK